MSRTRHARRPAGVPAAFVMVGGIRGARLERCYCDSDACPRHLKGRCQEMTMHGYCGGCLAGAVTP